MIEQFYFWVYICLSSFSFAIAENLQLVDL
jgi:hypothetical protein